MNLTTRLKASAHAARDSTNTLVIISAMGARVATAVLSAVMAMAIALSAKTTGSTGAVSVTAGLLRVLKALSVFRARMAAGRVQAACALFAKIRSRLAFLIPVTAAAKKTNSSIS